MTSQQSLNPEQRELISGALGLHEPMLRVVLVPRRSVLSPPADVTMGEARTAMTGAGHSRAPVTGGNHLDDVVGVRRWLSVISGDDAALGTVATPAMVLPDTARISNALRQLKIERPQLAIVLDEHGAVDGIVTLDDLGVAIEPPNKRDHTTVAGIVLRAVPARPDPGGPGDIVELEGWSIEVLAVAHHAVTQERMRPGSAGP